MSERIRGAEAGPTLLLVAGLHGNEPAGVEACRRVLARLRERPPARGDVVALTGNTAALAAGRRYLERDLNRQWTDACVLAARSGQPQDAEAADLARLADEIDATLASARGPVIVLDLHTSSSAGVPFTIAGPTEADRDLATRLVVPAMLGLVDHALGTLTAHLGRRGCVAVAAEGGQHGDPATIANLEAVVLVALAAGGLCDPDDDARALLERARGTLPPAIDVVARHGIPAGAAFRMEPGFANIQRAAAGTLLAIEDGREIRAPFDGFVLLPLYQEQGDDGFFYGR